MYVCVSVWCVWFNEATVTWAEIKWVGLLWDEAVSSSKRKRGKLYLNNVSLLKMEMLALSADWNDGGESDDGGGIIILTDKHFVASKHLWA